MIITYRTDREALERIVPEPLEVVDSIVKYEFIRMPDSTGFGAYAGAAQVIVPLTICQITNGRGMDTLTRDGLSPLTL